jgi:hypothetical protein
VTDLRVVPDAKCARADWTFAPLQRPAALQLSTDALSNSQQLAADNDDASSSSSSSSAATSLAKPGEALSVTASLRSMLRADSVDNLLLHEQASIDDTDSRLVAALRSARMLCWYVCRAYHIVSLLLNNTQNSQLVHRCQRCWQSLTCF